LILLIFSDAEKDSDPMCLTRPEPLIKIRKGHLILHI
ncbi:MAG: hypothetical protein ACI823_000058, partial [Chitinophagales bacterium]